MPKKKENKLKAKKFLSVDKVARRTLKVQKAFDEAADLKRNACEQALSTADGSEEG